MLFIPEEYQQRAINFATPRDATYIAFDTGLGKTGTGATIVSHWYDEAVINNCLVVAPPSVVLHTWLNEIKKFHKSFGWFEPVPIIGSPKQREKLMEQPSLMHLVSFNNLVWLINEWGSDWPWECIVFDEISRMKSTKSERFKTFKPLRKNTVIKKVLGLGGTPAPNGYPDLWAQCYCVDGGRTLGTGVTKYRRQYFYQDYLGFNYILHDWAKDVIDEKLKTLMVGLRKEDYLSLPPIKFNKVYIDLPPKAKAAYDQLVSDHIIDVDTETVIESDTEGSDINKLRQICNGFVFDDEKNVHILHDEKLKALESLIEEAGGEPVIVAYQFIPDKDAIIKRFGKRVRVIDDDPKLIEQWDNGEIDILLMYGGGESHGTHGLNLQYGGRIIINYGETWDYETYYQIISRVYRRGQERTTFIHSILTRNTREKDVSEALETKGNINDDLLKKVSI